MSDDKLVHSVTLRFGDELREMVDEYTRWVEQETGVTPSQGDVMRSLAQRGFRTWKETQHQKKKGRVS